MPKAASCPVATASAAVGAPARAERLPTVGLALAGRPVGSPRSPRPGPITNSDKRAPSGFGATHSSRAAGHARPGRGADVSSEPKSAFPAG